MSEYKNQEEIEEKRLQIDRIRRGELEILTDPFKRGQLAGAQQALWWILGIGMDPVKAILSDAEIALLEDEPTLPGLEPVEPIVETEDNEGWGWPNNSRKAHYFVGGRSLCNRWMYFGELDQGNDESSHNCVSCKRKLRKRAGSVKRTYRTNT